VDAEYLAGIEHMECAISAELGRRVIRIRNLHKVVGEIGKVDNRTIVVTEAEESPKWFRITGTDGGDLADMKLDRWDTEGGEGKGTHYFTIVVEKGNGGEIKVEGRMEKGDITPKGIVEVFQKVWWDNLITPF
jgi:hypothetical protein